VCFVRALKDTCSVELINSRCVGFFRWHIGYGIVGNAVDCLKSLIGKGICEYVHIAGSCSLFVVAVFFVDDSVVDTVINIGLIPGITVLKCDCALVIKLVHTSRKLYCLCICQIVVGAVGCDCLSVYKPHLYGIFDVTVVPCIGRYILEGNAVGKRCTYHHTCKNKCGKCRYKKFFHVSVVLSHMYYYSIRIVAVDTVAPFASVIVQPTPLVISSGKP